MADLQTIVGQVQERFTTDVLEVVEFRGEVTLLVAAGRLVDVLTFLRDTPTCNFEMLVDATATDNLGSEPRFRVLYHLISMKNNLRVRVKVPVGGETPEIPSASGVYPNANWYEREMYDLMGIRFSGHPDLTRILLPEDWMGHPLRKDHPLVYEEVAFTHNVKRIHEHKPFAKD
ncbi:MAG: NADH-quinone oxidoreductase subunit C [Chloroflexi bacterium]|nr:NADH-quinone oxidoreductase subunit C [Chloroflexota bacterium]